MTETNPLRAKDCPLCGTHSARCQYDDAAGRTRCSATSNALLGGPVTKETDARNFEHAYLQNADGTPLRARRNGRTVVWKTRLSEFRIPIKHGLYTYGEITEWNANEWRVA